MTIQNPHLISVCPHSCLFCVFLPLDPCVDAGGSCWWISGCRILLLHQFLEETCFKPACLLALLSSFPPFFPCLPPPFTLPSVFFPPSLPTPFLFCRGNWRIWWVTRNHYPRATTFHHAAAGSAPPSLPVLSPPGALGISSSCLTLSSPLERNSIVSTWFYFALRYICNTCKSVNYRSFFP